MVAVAPPADALRQAMRAGQLDVITHVLHLRITE